MSRATSKYFLHHRARCSCLFPSAPLSLLVVVVVVVVVEWLEGGCVAATNKKDTDILPD